MALTDGPPSIRPIHSGRAHSGTSSAVESAGIGATVRFERYPRMDDLVEVEGDPERIERRVRTGYCDRLALTLDEALDICEDALDQKRAISVGLVGNCAEVLPELVRRGVRPDHQ